jgi:lysophospholipase L1-like esterase
MKIGTWILRRLGRLTLLAALAAPGCINGPITDPGSPVFFDISGNDQKIVVSFGGSIAAGEGSPTGAGYREDLQQLFILAGRPGLRVLDESLPKTTSTEGAGRIAEVLRRDRPAALVLLYGENDDAVGLPAGAPTTQRDDTVAALRTIILAARSSRTLVAISTLPPVCGDGRMAQRGRTAELNEKISALARELSAGDLGVVLVDAWRDFVAAAPPDGCRLIGESGDRPNVDGYRVLAASFAAGLKPIAW